MDGCYPKTLSIINTELSCNHEWRLQHVIGTDGTYGEIWSVCCNNQQNIDCNHVMKYMPYNDGIRMNQKEDILKEIDLQRRCGNIGLCPMVQEAWLCEKGGAFVMEIYQMTARQLLLIYPNINDKQKILANIITLLDKLHRYGIYHGDLHLDNIMIKGSQENLKYADSDYEYYFIDFGKGGNVESLDSDKIMKDYIEISAHIQDLIDEYPNQGFDELYDTMKIYMKKFD